ncbi:MAG: hypothetical protein H6Q13_2671 [Bacteroidetes bacterium]|jgi:Icc-related predicted phosphoesterase|nr:hypothetical protein [Bacteroidota bacterium]
MKIQYASDLHVEFKDNSSFLRENPLKVEADVLVLGGDIALFERRWEKHDFFDWCADHFEQTYIVFGNHEYYSGFDVGNTLYNYEYKLRANVQYVNNQSLRIENTELFFTTLWSVIKKEELMSVQMGLSDCRFIILHEKRMTSSDYSFLHDNCKSWLEKALRVSTANHKIVVSHHCPTERFKDPRFIESTINSAFVVDMEQFIKESDIDCWIYGHTHYNGGQDFRIGNTLMKTNQLGYVKYLEHQTFNPSAFIEVK